LVITIGIFYLRRTNGWSIIHYVGTGKTKCLTSVDSYVHRLLRTLFATHPCPPITTPSLFTPM